MGHHLPDTKYHDDYIPTPSATHHKYPQNTACLDRPPPTAVASPHNHPQDPVWSLLLFRGLKNIYPILWGEKRRSVSHWRSIRRKTGNDGRYVCIEQTWWMNVWEWRGDDELGSSPPPHLSDVPLSVTTLSPSLNTCFSYILSSMEEARIIRYTTTSRRWPRNERLAIGGWLSVGYYYSVIK